MNIYCSDVSLEAFFNSKEAAMIEKCKSSSGEIAQLEALNRNTIANALSDINDEGVERIVVTDQYTKVIYDSNSSNSIEGHYALYPEIYSALDGKNVFYSKYTNGVMYSATAMPVYAYNTQIGCVYIIESDAAQGTLIATLQNSIFIITIVLEAIVILFSVIHFTKYTDRIRKIMGSIRNVRQGDYTHRLQMQGNDELNDLGNEFNDLISRLQISENKRSQFVSDASHELKTPLASIKLLTDSILQNTMDVETTREFVADIGSEADRLNRMSQKLLTLSRSDASIAPEFEITYIAPTIERAIRMLGQIAENSDVHIHLDVQHDLPILIYEDDLYQVIFNLIENGIKYNKIGGDLFITLSSDDNDAVITIRDTGVGIPKESLDNIFERFYRVDKDRSRKSGGSGLGLSIVNSIVERNNGTIQVESEVGVGTEFRLRFPVFYSEEDLK